VAGASRRLGSAVRNHPRWQKKERLEQRLLQPFHVDVFANINAEERCSIARPQ
jgi:hypothetical protein